jgi:hypothetical protein
MHLMVQELYKYRKDRKDGFGGVMLAIKSNINSNPIDIATVTDCDCEIIARKIECDSNKSLIVIHIMSGLLESKTFQKLCFLALML